MIAIHNSLFGFHPRWVEYCRSYLIPFKLVNCYTNDLVEQLHDCQGLLWHHSQNDPQALIAAKPILFALEQAGIKVFPDFYTNWHFDDKIGQKYLLEAIGVAFVPTYVFYDKNAALEWARCTSLPKVFKLRGGAGSANVKLVRTHYEIVRFIHKGFGNGYSNYDAISNFKERLRKWRLGKTSFFNLTISFLRLFFMPKYAKIAGRERGYVYFQDFIANNDHDIRVIVIGNKAFAIKRLVRKNDFRASGSGNILYGKEYFDNFTIQLAFGVHRKLKSQCTAMDFVLDKGQSKLVEISYGFDPKGYEECPGYWDQELNWHEGKFNPYGWMVELLLNENS